MNCIEFEAALERGIETRSPLAQAAFEHTSACPDCRLKYAIHRQLDDVIAFWRPEVGVQAFDCLDDLQRDEAIAVGRPIQRGVDLVESVLAELALPVLTHRLMVPNGLEDQRKTGDRFESRTKASVPRRGRSGSLAIASVAACLVIAVVFMTQTTGRNSSELAQVPRARIIEPVTAQLPLDVSQTLTEVFSDLRSEYREMASETTSAARDLVNAIPNRVAVPVRPRPDEIVLRPTSSDVTRIWLPISNRVESALGFLRQAVPNQVPSG